MSTNEHQVGTMSDTELREAVETFKHTNPKIEEALRVLDISNAAYETSLRAMYATYLGRSNSINQTLPGSR